MKFALLWIITGLVMAIFTATRCTRQELKAIPPLSWCLLVFTWPWPVVKGVYEGVEKACKRGANAPPFAPTNAQACAHRPKSTILPKVNATMPEVGKLTPAQEALLDGLQIEMHRALAEYWRGMQARGETVTSAGMQEHMRAWVEENLTDPKPTVTVCDKPDGGFDIDVNYCAPGETPQFLRTTKDVL